MSNGDPVSHDKLGRVIAELINTFNDKFATTKRADDIDEQLDALRNVMLTEDDIYRIFNDLFKSNKALGWNNRKNWIAIITVILLLAGLILQAYNHKW